MASRDITPETQALATVFKQHRERRLDGITRVDAAKRAGMSESIYRNIEAGREVSAETYRKAARNLGLPGGDERVDAILAGLPDPGDGLAVARFSRPVAVEDGAAGQLAEVLDRFEQLYVLLAAEIERLDARLAKLEPAGGSRTRTVRPPRRRAGSQ